MLVGYGHRQSNDFFLHLHLRVHRCASFLGSYCSVDVLQLQPSSYDRTALRSG